MIPPVPSWYRSHATGVANFYTRSDSERHLRPPGPGGAAASTDSGLRQVTDARTMRALAHPVRIALIEALSLSFHLRQLAKYGFVEDAGQRPGRSRPWRMTSIGREFTPADDDPEAVMALVRMARERQFARYRTWLDTRANYPKAWRDAAGDSEYTFFVTAEELDQLNPRRPPGPA